MSYHSHHAMSNKQSQYLESKVLTSPPHRLHLMLIEGALRCGRQAESLLQQGDTAGAGESLMRTINLVGEMLAGVRESKTAINRQLTDLYWFVFRRVSEAKIHLDAKKLAEALRLLEYERQTWLAICEKFGQPAENPPVRAPHLLAAANSTSRLSLEA